MVHPLAEPPQTIIPYNFVLISQLSRMNLLWTKLEATWMRSPRLVAIHLPIFALSFVDAFIFLDVFFGVILPDDTTEVVNANIIDAVEEGNRVTNVPVMLVGLPTGGFLSDIVIIFRRFRY